MKAVLGLALLSMLLASSGCDDEPEKLDGDWSCLESDPRNKCSMIEPRKDGGGSGDMEIALDCRDVQRDAFTLLRDSQRCEQDSDCVVESIASRCLSAFLCPVPASRSADLGSLRQQALTLSLEEQRCRVALGPSCPIARCAVLEAAELGCDPATKLCARRSAFVDSPVSSADAGDAARAQTGRAMDASVDAAIAPAGDGG